MHMTFHLGFDETILFDQWKTVDHIGILGSSIGIILMGIIYEGIKHYREYISITNAGQKFINPNYDLNNQMFSTVHLYQTFLHLIQLVFSYFLMFVFMTFNVYLCTAVLIGCTVGYLIFAWKNPKINVYDCCS